VTRVLVLGSGLSGIAAARLAAKEGMAPSIFTEGTDTEALSSGFGFASGSWDPVLLNGVDLVVASPGFPERSLPIVEALEWGIPVWSEIEFASRYLDCPLVGVTGTNGKTTVTEATSAMLEASGLRAPATGNIGVPLSDQVGIDNDALVVEVSSFQLRFCETFHPIAAGITNVAVDHLDWHGSAAAYREAKARIFANQTSSDLLVYDADDLGAAELARAAPSRLYPISGSRVPEGGGGSTGGTLVVGDVEIDIDELESPDPVHLANLAMASALALGAGASVAGVVEAATKFRPGPHRREVVVVADGVTWIDDSKATNLHAALASIRARGPVVLVAGGLSKGIDVTPVAAEPNVRHLVGIGEAGPSLAAAAGERGHTADSMDEAVAIADALAEAGDTVLLAPACASFDQFASYAERGDQFARAVRHLKGDVGS
jgi:UDP-N-acetylmuramoylalanine--D-glutamate ligase